MQIKDLALRFEVGKILLVHVAIYIFGETLISDDIKANPAEYAGTLCYSAGWPLDLHSKRNIESLNMPKWKKAIKRFITFRLMFAP